MVANYEFIDDITIPDDMQIAAGAAFTKVWRLRNNGDVNWTSGFTLRFKAGEQMGTTTSVPLPPCAVGKTVDVALPLTAPNTPGTAFTDWMLHDADGNPFGKYPVYARVTVMADGTLHAQPDGDFAADLTIPDDTIINLDASFEKKWLVRNTGNIAWTDGFKLVWVDGEQLGNTYEVPLPPTNVGATSQVAVTFTAPSTPGTVFSDWQFQDANGTKFGNLVYVRINAQPVEADGVNDLTGVTDITVPDDKRFNPDKTFTKTWLVRNTGTLPWTTAYSVRMINGTPMPLEDQVYLTGEVQPGEEVELSVDLKTPSTNGTYYTDFKLHDPDGNSFGDIIYTRIVVQGATSGDSTKIQEPVNPYANVPLQAAAPFFSQRDPRWGKNKLGSHRTLTIEQWGCMMTCNAMILAWKGINFTPATLNDYMRNQNIYQQGYLTPWNTATLVNSNVAFDARLIKQGMQDKVFGTYLGTIVNGNQIIQKVDEYLQRGIPVMLNVDITPNNAYNSSDTHWVVAVSRYNNDYLVNDPAEQTSGVISLQKKYGRSNSVLADAITQAILYH